jgi:predicted kinase
MIGKTYTEVFETTVGEANVTMEADVRLAIVKEFSVVWDQTNLRAKKRKKVLDKFNNYVKICINFDTPPEAEYYKRLYKRAGLEGKYIPIGILNSMAGTYQVPMIEEGFDKVFHNPDEAIEYIRENI